MIDAIILAGKDFYDESTAKELRRKRFLSDRELYATYELERSLVKVNNIPLLQHVLDACASSEMVHHVSVVGTPLVQEYLRNTCANASFVLQGNNRIDNIMRGYNLLRSQHESTENRWAIVLTGDCPLIGPQFASTNESVLDTLIDEHVSYFSDERVEAIWPFLCKKDVGALTIRDPRNWGVWQTTWSVPDSYLDTCGNVLAKESNCCLIRRADQTNIAQIGEYATKIKMRSIGDIFGLIADAAGVLVKRRSTALFGSIGHLITRGVSSRLFTNTQGSALPGPRLEEIARAAEFFLGRPPGSFVISRTAIAELHPDGDSCEDLYFLASKMSSRNVRNAAELGESITYEYQGRDVPIAQVMGLQNTLLATYTDNPAVWRSIDRRPDTHTTLADYLHHKMDHLLLYNSTTP